MKYQLKAPWFNVEKDAKRRINVYYGFKEDGKMQAALN